MKMTRKIALAAVLAAAAALPAGAQDFNARPNYGEVNLRTGFNADPRTIDLRAGGEVNAQSLSPACRGFITNAPDVRLNFTAGSNLPLILSVASGADTTLIVNAPDGSFYCDDDGGVNGANPAVRFNNPQTGRYEIWVGTYASGGTQPARLHISEVTSQ
jgi:hypothetical protein